MSDRQTRRVGFIGLGNIGYPIALRLARAGIEVTAFDAYPRPDRVQELSDAGATIASSLEEVAREQSVLVTLLPDSEIVETVLTDRALTDALAPGALVIEMSSGYPPDTVRIARELASRGLRVVDAPICNGGVRGAENGTLTLALGGNASDTDLAGRVLAPVASVVRRVGELGTAHTVKLISNLISNAVPALVSEAFAIGKAAGIPISDLRDALVVCAAGNAVDIEALLPAPQSDLTAAGTFRAELAAKDMRYVAALAGQRSVPHLFADAAHEFFLNTSVAGYSAVEASLSGWAWLVGRVD